GRRTKEVMVGEEIEPMRAVLVGGPLRHRVGPKTSRLVLVGHAAAEEEDLRREPARLARARILRVGVDELPQLPDDRLGVLLHGIATRVPLRERPENLVERRSGLRAGLGRWGAGSIPLRAAGLGLSARHRLVALARGLREEIPPAAEHEECRHPPREEGPPE